MNRFLQIAISVLFAVGIMSFAPTSYAQTLRANGKIAFTSDRDGNLEIYLMNADGTDQVRLTNNPGVDDFPTFSPDGTKIAFVSQTPSHFAIKTMNVDGTGQVEITQIDFAPTPYPWHQKMVFELVTR